VLVTVAVGDVLRVVVVLLGGGVAGLVPAVVVLWATGVLEPPRMRPVTREVAPRRPAVPPVADAPAMVAAPSLAFATPAALAAVLETDRAPAPSVPDPVGAAAGPAGDVDEPAADRRRELYETEYAEQLRRLAALRLRIASEMEATPAVAETEGPGRPEPGPPPDPDTP
jgi:hypothetical protein